MLTEGVLSTCIPAFLQNNIEHNRTCWVFKVFIKKRMEKFKLDNFYIIESSWYIKGVIIRWKGKNSNYINFDGSTRRMFESVWKVIWNEQRETWDINSLKDEVKKKQHIPVSRLKGNNKNPLNKSLISISNKIWWTK